MTCKSKVIILSIVFGILSGLIDSVVDCLFFYAPVEWHKIAFFDVPMHEIYLRTVMLLLFIIFGLILARILDTKERLKRELQHSKRNLDHLRSLTAKLEASPPEK